MQTHFSASIDSRAYSHGRLASIRRLALAGWSQLRAWHRVYRQRRELLRLDDGALKDLGITRSDALEEGLTPFWRGPSQRG